MQVEAAAREPQRDAATALAMTGAAPTVTRSAPAVTGAAPATKRRFALSLADAGTLCAIGVVVVLVSLPKLRAFAVRENEFDALRALRLLASDATARGGALRAGGLGALLATNDSHRVRLEDVELCADGRLRRHGYLFDAVETAPGTWVLRAWPWEHPHTGLGAFLTTPGGAVHGWANADGAFSGPALPPPALLDPVQQGWLPMRAESR